MSHYPGATVALSPNFGFPGGSHGRNGQIIRGIVEHRTAGPGAVSWFQNPASQVSANYVILLDGTIVCCVEEEDAAWHAGVVQPQSEFYGETNPNLWCVTSETKILRSNMVWTCAGDLSLGDSIVGCDEYPLVPNRRRNLQMAHINGVGFRKEPTYRLSLSSGVDLRSTSEHKWLVRKYSGAGHNQHWLRTDDLFERFKKGQKLVINRYFSTTVNDETRDAGYLAAAFDGEGNIRYTRGEGIQLCFSQRDNAMLNLVSQLLHVKGFDFHGCFREPNAILNYRRNPVFVITLRGGRREVFRFLSEIAPARLLENWQRSILPNWPMTKISADVIENIEYAGEKEIATIGSTSKTYFAEGYVAHNTVGVEHEANTGNTGPLTAAQLDATTKLHKYLFEKYGYLEIITHDQIDSGRTCPGPGFPLQDIEKIAFSFTTTAPSSATISSGAKSRWATLGVPYPDSSSPLIPVYEHMYGSWLENGQQAYLDPTPAIRKEWINPDGSLRRVALDSGVILEWHKLDGHTYLIEAKSRDAAMKESWGG